MKITFALAGVIALCTNLSNVAAQTPKPIMDSISYIISDVSQPYEIRRGQKGLFGFILVQLSQKLKVQRIDYSRSIPAKMVEKMNEIVIPRFSKLKWAALFPGIHPQKINYVVIPFWYSFHSKSEAENYVPLAELTKTFSEAMALKQLQRPVLMVMTEPIKADVEILGGEKGSR